ncbi:EAL domain-containing protein [Alkalimonas collagenimarina]|uniref:EAL domain-containing protein n=1 Tax=Alkalimonas collagenimarina TaxID=400390 RepID=A0ABT9H096_9GAMM|nr:EAL domain-containing protein [Alkalimonas collagenimarina]MDP4536727.1 EAL domain-containing protein [Alkalimonas collagenimarina]
MSKPSSDEISELAKLKQQLAKLEDENHELQIINQLAVELHQLNDLKEITDYVANTLAQALGFEDCAIYLYDSQLDKLRRFSAAGSRNVADDQGYSQISMQQGIVGYCASKRQTVMVNDTREQPLYILDITLSLSELAVPVVDEGELLAVIDSEHQQANYFTERHRTILEAIAPILAAKLRRMQTLTYLEESVDKLEYAEKLQKSLYEIAAFAYFADELNEFYTHVHQIVSSLIYAPNFYIALYDIEKEHLNFPYFVDTRGDEQPNTIYPIEILNNSLTGLVFRTDRPLLLDRKSLLKMYEEGQLKAYGDLAACWLGVPFHSGDSVHGVVVVQSYIEDIHYDQSDLELLTFVAQHISNALERVFSERKLQHLALHDNLTGLPNRGLFLDRVNHAFQRMQRFPEQKLAVMYLDLDKFKAVNDTHGHAIGDAFLIAVGRLLKLCMRQSDTLARLGGDEFAILLEDVDKMATIEEVARRILSSLQKPVVVGDFAILASTSIGISFCELDTPGLVPDELIRRADIAMYQAKKDGRGIYRIYNESMQADDLPQWNLEQDLKIALAGEQLLLKYQPIVSLTDQSIQGFEALLRWEHEEHGSISPDQFIPIAEQSRLIVRIDHYVLRQAMAQAARWYSINKHCYISVNVCSMTISDPDFVSWLQVLMQQYQLPASCVALEITERALIENIAQAKKCIQQLRAIGIRVFLDDFGTGYSSLSYLSEFKLDVLKIDRSFIGHMQDGMTDHPIVNTIIALAKTMQLRVVAEGIETELQQQILQQLGCDYGQGYLFARPLMAEEAEAWLR